MTPPTPPTFGCQGDPSASGRPGSRRCSVASAFPLLAVLLGLLLLGAPPLSAWGANGHRAVGEIAQNHLTPAAELEVERLLGGESLARVSDWADRIRSRPEEWGHTYPWHYINVGDEQRIETVERHPDGDILSALDQLTAVLRDPEAPFQQKADALRLVVHFVGDLHQPLHVGRAEDRGGNDTDVEWFGETENLHRVWDSGIIERQSLSYSELVRFIDRATPKEIRAWQGTPFRDWAEESQALRSQVYDFGEQLRREAPAAGVDGQPQALEALPRLGWRYLDRNQDVVEQRLLQAGLRLAGLLNELFDPDA